MQQKRERDKDEKETEQDLLEYKKKYEVMKKIIEQQTKTIAEQNQTIAEQNQTIAEKNQTIAEQNQTIAEQEKVIDEKNKKIKETKQLFTSTLDTKKRVEPLIFLKYDEMQKCEINSSSDSKMNEEHLNDCKKKFLEMIEKIGIEKGEKKIIQDIIAHKLGDTLDINKFIESFEKAVINLNSSKDNKESIKNFLHYFNETNNLIFDKNTPLHIRQFQMDLVIDILINYDQKNNLQKECLLESNYTKVPFTKGISFNVDNKKYQFDKEYIKDLISSNIGILNGFKKMLQIFVTTKEFNYETLINDINDIINSSNIYFIDLPKDVYGLTICNGDIFIKSEYLCEALNESENSDFRLTAIAKIYLTLLHELCHKLQHTLRCKNSNNDKIKENYFNKSFIASNIKKDYKFDVFDEIDKSKLKKQLKEYPIKDKTSIHYSLIFDENLSYNESGDFFDSDIYIGYNSFEVSIEMANFFLFYGCYNYNNYKAIMEKLFLNNSSPKKCTSNSSFKRNKKNSRFGCLFSLTRNLE